MPTRSSLPGLLFGLLFGLLGPLFAAQSSGCGPAPENEPNPPIASRSSAVKVSRCEANALQVTCTKRELSLPALLLSRTVHYELPVGTPPPGGWPVAIYFQGSFFAGGRAFVADRDDPFGAYNLALTIKSLLDAGYAVLAPDALVGGATFWQTNVPPFSALWTTSSDHAFMSALFQALWAGRFGPVDASRLYAMGISSGGFMTSRMAVSYRGLFRALAVHSASYATCSALCLVPPLPSDHPPTLFLHGRRDLIVTSGVMEQYRDALVKAGFETKTVLSATAGHEWLAEGPQAVTDWFDAHP